MTGQQTQTFWLGSQSPRRHQLVEYLGLRWHTAVADVDEDIIDIPDPKQNVLSRARLKGEALRQQLALGDDDFLVTADTTVALRNELLNKPATPAEAREMLRKLEGRWHQVHTGMVVYHGRGGAVREDVCTTAVLMRPYNDKEIEAYIATGDPFDKAGGYAIQHPVFQPVAALLGCYLGVMGLSICRLKTLLGEMGVILHMCQHKTIEDAHQEYPCAV